MTRQASHHQVANDLKAPVPLPRYLAAIQPYIPGNPARRRGAHTLKEKGTSGELALSPALLAELCERISAAPSADEALQVALVELPRLTGARYVWVQLHEKREGAETGRIDDEPVASDVSGDAAIPTAVPSPAAASVTRSAGRLRLLRRTPQAERAASIETPVGVGQQVLGTLYVQPGNAAAPTTNELATLRLIGLTLGQALLRHGLRASPSSAHGGEGADTETTEAQTSEFENARRWNLFLAHVAHEIRTPLTCIKGHAQLLQRQALGMRNEKTGRLTRSRVGELAIACERHLGALDAQVTRIERLIRDMIDLAGTAEGRLHLQLERHDLAQIVRQMVATLDLPSASALTLDLPAKAPLICDGARIEQALYAVTQHALRSGGHEAGLTMTLGERRQGKVRQRLLLVGDMPLSSIGAELDEQIHKYALTLGPEHVQSPLDLDLALSVAIVEHHGGALCQLSDAQRNSGFLFVLPVDGPLGASSSP